MSKIKLKKCPFCGGEVEIDNIGDFDGDNFYMVECKNSECNSAISFGEINNKEDFIRIWNNRKPINNIIEKLEVGLDKLQEDAINDKCRFGEYYATTRAIKIVKEYAE